MLLSRIIAEVPNTKVPAGIAETGDLDGDAVLTASDLRLLIGILAGSGAESAQAMS